MIYNNITIIIIIIIIAVFYNYEIYSQEEVFPLIFKFLEHRIVKDVVFDHETAWIITNEGLIRENNDTIIQFGLDSNSNGDLMKYKDMGSYNCPYHYIKYINNTVWLATIDGKHILEIKDNNITNYSNMLEYDPLFFLKNLEVNSDGALWLLFGNSKMKKYKLISLSSQKQKLFKLNNVLSKYNVHNFFIKDNFKYFIVSDHNLDYFILKFTKNNLFESIKLLRSDSYLNFEYFTSNENLYLMNDEGYLYIIGKDFSILEEKQINITASISFNFFIHDEYIYVSNSILDVINLNTLQSSKYKSKYFSSNCFYEYNKIRLNEFSKLIWCIYGGVLKGDCAKFKDDEFIPKINRAGVSIFKLN